MISNNLGTFITISNNQYNAIKRKFLYTTFLKKLDY